MVRVAGSSRWLTLWLPIATALAVAVAAIGGYVVVSGIGSPTATSKPNIVMIMTDDQWLESMRAMPRTRDLIGGQGVTFDDYYASEAICCPSRATYLSGQFAHNNGVRHNGPPQGGYAKLDEENTLPVWLRDAGYATSHIGKYPNGYGKNAARQVPPGWTEWRGSIDPSTYRMWGYTLNENGRLRTYGEPDDEDPAMYQTDVYRDKSVDFIERRSGKGEPFFLSTAFLAPHGEELAAMRATHRRDGTDNDGTPPDRADAARKRKADAAGIRPAPRPAPRHEGEFDDLQVPHDSSFAEGDTRDKPAYMRAYDQPNEEQRGLIEDSYRGRMESLLAVDEAVSGIVDALERSGQLDNTYLMFTSDNGFFFGEHNIPTGKYLPHEVSSHLPLLLRGPGIPAGERSRELVSNVDLAATIADLGGATPSHATDGRSMLPYARDPQRGTSGRPILHEAGAGALRTSTDSTRTSGMHTGAKDPAGRAAARGDLDQDLPAAPGRKAKKRPPPGKGQVLTVAYEALRTDRYMLVRYTTGERELYDYERDPHELESRHDDPRYAKVRRAMERELDTVQKCEGDACDASMSDPPDPG